jgi:hypothetical protein
MRAHDPKQYLSLHQLIAKCSAVVRVSDEPYYLSQLNFPLPKSAPSNLGKLSLLELVLVSYLPMPYLVMPSLPVRHQLCAVSSKATTEEPLWPL